jgi:hypothetical protein
VPFQIQLSWDLEWEAFFNAQVPPAPFAVLPHVGPIPQAAEAVVAHGGHEEWGEEEESDGWWAAEGEVEEWDDGWEAAEEEEDEDEGGEGWVWDQLVGGWVNWKGKGAAPGDPNASMKGARYARADGLIGFFPGKNDKGKNEGKGVSSRPPRLPHHGTHLRTPRLPHEGRSYGHYHANEKGKRWHTVALRARDRKGKKKGKKGNKGMHGWGKGPGGKEPGGKGPGKGRGWG